MQHLGQEVIVMESNRISRQLKDYLEYKHSLGFKLTHEATVLKRFAVYTRSINYDGPLTTEIVLKWVASGKQSDKTMGRKIEVIRPFSKYVYSFDHESEIIYSLIFKNVHERPTPYIYIRNQMSGLLWMHVKIFIHLIEFAHTQQISLSDCCGLQE